MLNKPTPVRTDVLVPKMKLFDILEKEYNGMVDPISEIIPLNTDLEILLINSCKIDAIKVQTIVEEFMVNKKTYINILHD